MKEPALRLNLKHLRYFTEVARHGSVTHAAHALHVAPQTVSAQLRELEGAIGHPLFERRGRRLILTRDGEVAREYAMNLFGLADELASVLRGRSPARRAMLRVGIPDHLPKLQTVAAIEPVVSRHRDRVELVCHEGTLGVLLGRLAAHELDAVLSEVPVPPDLAKSLQGRLLVQSGVSFLAAPALARRVGRGFPANLDQAPFLASSEQRSFASQAVASWLAGRNVQVAIVGHFDDSALMKCFAERGLGVIAIPTAVEREVMRQHSLMLVGRAPEVTQSLFLVRPRRQRVHPLVLEIEQGTVGKPR